MSTRYDMTAEALQGAGYRPIHAGDTYDHQFTVTVGGVALDLTGAKLWLTVKESTLQTDADAKLQLTSDVPEGGEGEPEGTPDIEVTDETGGAFTVHFLPDATGDLEGTWNYDLQAKVVLEGDATKIMTLAYGVIQFLPNLTRATS